MADTFPYPNGSVVGVLADPAAAEALRSDLDSAGFTSEVLHGEAGLARIDVEGTEHGSGGRWLRWLQSIFSEDADDARRYQEHLQAGRAVIGVNVGDDEAAKGRAAAALRAAGADDVRYYAENYVEDLRV